MSKILEKIDLEQRKPADQIPDFKVGDTVDVHVRIREGDKERIQVYSGVVIARKGHGARENFTVRRVSYGEGVERVFPLHSPNVAKVEMNRHGKIRRAKLYYLRDLAGKKARIKETRE
ncbi:MAG: 50S ribosomal protein L19 [Kiritimatiellia bacterium]